MTTVILFDIDGTLLNAHGAGRRAMEAGFVATVGRADGLETIRFGGMTDPSIVRAGLLAMDIEADDSLIAEVIERYLERLPEQLSQQPPRVLPGVAECLDLVDRSGVAVGVGTGNVEAGARAKLAAVGLEHRFAFGGFGSDHEQRDQLLRAGAMRGAAQLLRPLDECRVLVVGDTPRDVEAAAKIGAECLAVATSYYDAGTLAQTGASEVVADLCTTQAREWFLRRIGGPVV